MKIISNFKDYYDGAAAKFGYSDDIVLKRLNSLEIFKKDGNNDVTDRLKIRVPSLYRNIQDSNVILGVCGKLYPIMIYGEEVFYSFIPKDIRRIKEIYDIEKKKPETIKSYKLINTCKEFLVSAGIMENDYWGIQVGKNKGYLDVIQNHEIFQDIGVTSFLMYINKQPIVENFKYIGSVVKEDYTKFLGRDGYIGSTSSIILNPILKELQFTKVMDQFTLLQEIEMYMGRLSENNTPAMPVGSNKVIAESKGYDKWSFRKMPTKKVKK